jgi:hypothetical protein
MVFSIAKHAAVPRSVRLWQIAWAVAAIVYAVPLAMNAYEALLRVNQQARTRLIEHHRLWESDPNFHGKPELWTRFASRLLNDSQLLARVAAKYGGQSEEIEVEYRRDLTLARAEVIVVVLAWWAGPLAALYGIGWLAGRREPPRPVKAEPASVSDPRYRPPADV